jgi:hypothetical protein
MIASRAFLFFLVFVALQPGMAAAAESPEEEARITRVFYLEGMDNKEAVTLLRAQLQVRQIAELTGRDVIIITESAEKADRAESLLHELGVLAGKADPHAPLSFARTLEEEEATRVFRIEGTETSTVVMVMRAIYQMREVTDLSEEDSVVVTAPLAKLDAAEALLAELGMTKGED